MNVHMHSSNPKQKRIQHNRKQQACIRCSSVETLASFAWASSLKSFKTFCPAAISEQLHCLDSRCTGLRELSGVGVTLGRADADEGLAEGVALEDMATANRSRCESRYYKT